jgi:hypothetical protein
LSEVFDMSVKVLYSVHFGILMWQNSSFSEWSWQPYAQSWRSDVCSVLSTY